MKVTMEPVILITALFAGALVNGEETPDPSKAKLAVACSKAFIWAGSIDKSQPIIRELIDAYHNSDDDDKKAIEDYRRYKCFGQSPISLGKELLTLSFSKGDDGDVLVTEFWRV
uniref:Uncharacterized protein LOC114328975 isoform X2 n=1 Tax=Diabrotica virgifera virgifera TaxID=50390 RepID=A0A6P7FDM7_DIAVI